MIGLTPVDSPSRAARVQMVVSPGGVRAWLVEDYAVPLVALEFAVRGGASQDPVGKAGAATMLSGLLDEGAGPYDAEAFHLALEEKAIELSFSAERDYFAGRLRTLVRHAEAAFDLLRLAVTEARLDAEPIERVRGQLSAGLRREAEDPDVLAHKAWRADAFPGHPYGRPKRGSLDSVAQITRDHLVELMRRAFARDELKVAVVGAIDAAKVARMLDDVFGGLPATGDRDAVPQVNVAGLGSRRVVDLDVPQTTIAFGRTGIARKDPDHIAAYVVNHILGGGVFSARLFKEVREKRGLAYSVYSSLSTYDHAACFLGGTSTKNERALESLQIIESEIDSLLREGPTEDELDKAQKYLIGSYDLRFDTSTKIAGQLAHLQVEGFDVSYLDERNKEIAAVTLDDARRVGKRLFGDGKLAVAMAGRPVGV
ncbi:MAG: insulinase family protein [Methylobacteriaceae bacterium]|nr:insulinase family protein [Methylobacteriaceae bacterium]